MILSAVDVCADPAIVDRYKGGFVISFHRQAQCIVEFYRGLLRRRVVTKDTRKLVYVFTESICQPPGKLVELDCQWPFDFARYTAATDTTEQKRLIAATLCDALVWSADQLGISADPFHEAYRKMSAANFSLRGISKSSWISPNGRHRARVAFTFDIDGVHLAALLFKNRSKREIGRTFLGVAPAQTECLALYLTNGRWVNDSVFELQSTDFMQKTWRADFSQLFETPPVS